MAANDETSQDAELGETYGAIDAARQEAKTSGLNPIFVHAVVANLRKIGHPLGIAFALEIEGWLAAAVNREAADRVRNRKRELLKIFREIKKKRGAYLKQKRATDDWFAAKEKRTEAATPDFQSALGLASDHR